MATAKKTAKRLKALPKKRHKKRSQKRPQKPPQKRPQKPPQKPPQKTPQKSPPKRPPAKVRPAARPKPLAKRVTDAPGQPPLGAHVSTAGGVAMAPARADDIGATAMQIFTKTPNQWKEPTITDAVAAGFHAALAMSGVRFTTAHDSYLINLASPDPAIRTRSLDSFRRELARCNTLGLNALVSHPGNFIDDRASGIARNADAITEALEAEPGPTRLLMELTAGQGTVIGSTFEEIAGLLERVPPALRARMGVCLDTCHVYSAGYDLVRDYDGVWARFADVIGLARLGCIHLNDSKTPFNSHRDRHELIGVGSLGKAPFERMMNDPQLLHVPKLLETPKGDDMVTNDRKMLRLLRSFAPSGR